MDTSQAAPAQGWVGGALDRPNALHRSALDPKVQQNAAISREEIPPAVGATGKVGPPAVQGSG